VIVGTATIFRAGRKLVEAAPDAVAVGGLRELLSAKPGLPALRVSPVEVALGNTYHRYFPNESRGCCLNATK